MDRQQIESMEHDSSYNSFAAETHRVSRETASHVLAGLFSQGTIPLTPANYLQQIISRIRVQASIKGRFRIMTIPLLVTHLSDSGAQLSIDSVEDISSTISILEAEIDPTPQTTCGVILHLSQKDKHEERKKNISQFVWNFITTSDRTTLVQNIIATGICPICTSDDEITNEDLTFDEHDWKLLLQGAITIACRKDSPIVIYEKAYGDWIRCGQTSSISEYVYREISLWKKLTSACGMVKFERPTNFVRVERLLRNLSDQTKSSLAITLKAQARRTESMTHAEIVAILDDLQTQSSISYNWEKPSRKAVNFAPQISTLPSPIPYDCGHCGKQKVRHNPDACFKNPKNQVRQRQRSNSLDSVKSRQTSNFETQPERSPGYIPQASEAPYTRSAPHADKPGSTPRSSTSQTHQYNLRPRSNPQ